jgi:hypothetical protein
MTPLEAHHGVINQSVDLARHELGIIRNGIGQANNVGVDPPASTLGQQVVAKQVGKPGRGSFPETAFIDEEVRPVGQFRRVAHTDPCGNGNVRIERIQVEVMSEIDKLFQAQPFLRRQGLAPPKRLKKLAHFGMAIGCASLVLVPYRMVAIASSLTIP